ncbi:winged helix-turn-helix domain-containing protein [Streptomyces sp. DvalAA-19]|uniref:winged helix-turn-helix domain-containing protein n=1 Tax=Streptomyces sp. DvalAA-19 TaxID=1839761 RepID=UPI000D1B3077|nr:winged helix-turn-helix domain-containing protein [Streptomyces sp. DvalAA-19]
MERTLRRARRPLPDHPVRVALLDLLAEVGTLTSTQAAARLGHSSGLCSFHLRQLALHGLIEEVPRKGGRARPWRLKWETADRPECEEPEEFGRLARELEDESYQHWVDHRREAPVEWQHDESFSAVVHLTPAEMAELAAAVRSLLAPYGEPNRRPGAGTMPVAAVTRLFPLLNENPAQPSAPPPDREAP